MNGREPMTLAELVADPARIDGLTLQRAAALLAEMAALQLAVAARLAVTNCAMHRGPEEIAERLLTVEQAAEITQMSRRQLYSAARRTDWEPFVVRINARTLRFRESGLRRRLRAKRT